MSLEQLLLIISLLTFSTNISPCSGNGNCEEKVTCEACIGVAGCAWCKQLKEPYSEFTRCQPAQAMQSKCPANDIIVPEPGEPKITVNEPIGETMRIQPQRVQLKLAVGKENLIDLSYFDRTDKDLDLYYIMDLSATMDDDKKTVSKQANTLVKALSKITKKVRLGFGSFIDKPVQPFVASSQLMPNEDFAEPYGFKNHLSLTDDIPEFTKVVERARISRNIDEPEGTLDALMQAITCTEQIGWRNTSRKLIVVATDGPFHIAGDGRLGGIVRPNDLKCHMENDMYTHSTILDYPSIGEINAMVLKHNVYVIFAVSTLQGNRVFKVYDELQNHITQSTAQQLNGDSSNVVQKIQERYLEISQRVEVTIQNRPSFVDVIVFANCTRNGEYIQQDYCDNVSIEKKINFKIGITLTECPDKRHPNLRNKNKVVVSFFGLSEREKLVIDLSYACDCKCNQDKNRNPNDLVRLCTNDNFAEYISCGLCTCKDDRGGKYCQCSKTGDEDFGNNTICINPKGNDDVECSNNGRCNCGQCECLRDYNGRYCEDSTLECQNQDRKICSDNGQCKKGNCECFAGYEEKHCECETSKKISSCVEPGQPSTNICSGNGECKCNENQAQCQCKSGYDSTYCEVCKINCPAKDEQNTRCKEEILQKCVRCRIRQFFDKKNIQCKQQCDWEKYLKDKEVDGKESRTKMKRSDISFYEFLELGLETKLSEVIGTECVVDINSTCKSSFKYKYQRGSQRDSLQVYYTPYEIRCAVEPQVIWYIFGVILAVLLIGILGLLIWKLATYLHDTREYQKFEKERAEAKWHGGENPLYSKPMSEFQNPAYKD